MIKEIIFDCFGVLTQDGWTVFLEKYGTQDTVGELRYLNTSVDKGLIGFTDFMKSICEISGANQQEVLKIMVESYHPEMKVFNLISQLKANYKIGLISNISDPVSSYLPTAPMELFDEQTLSYQVGVAKPSVAIFNLHLAKTGVLAEEAVFIDDREANCDGARAAGMKAIWYKNVEQLKEALQSLGVIIR